MYLDKARRSVLLGVAAGTAARVSAAHAQQRPDSANQTPLHSGVLDLASREAAIAANVPAQFSHLRLLGYYNVGDGGGALYARAERAPEHALWFQSADGALWTWNDTHLDVRMAGARGDGRYDANKCVILGGSDDTQAIQNAISAHCYFGLAGACHFPNRTFRITRTLHAHYGTSSEQCRLYGSWNHRGNNPSQHYGQVPSGTTILCDFVQGVGINIAGSYGAHIRGLTLIGRNAAWITANNLGYGSPPAIDDTLPESWIDPVLPKNASDRYSPYAGIAIDAWYEKGRNNYPSIAFPSFLKKTRVDHVSTEALIEECYISGFVAGVADAPGGAPYSSDYIKLRRVVFERCQYGLSEGQSQQRNMIRESCTYTRCYCAETTNAHGAQQGTFGPAINCSYAAVIHLFKLFSTGGGAPYFNGVPAMYLGCYGETIWRLGDVEANSPVETAVVFDSCSFSFDAQSVASRGAPATVMGGYSPGTPVRIVFRDTRLYTYASVCPIMFGSECVSADGLCMLSGNGIGISGNNYVGQGLRSEPFQRFASNTTADGLILWDGCSRTGHMRLKFAQYDLDAGAPTPQNVRNVICGPTQASDRARTACAYMQRLAGVNEPYAEGTWLPQQAFQLDKHQLKEFDLSNRTLRFILPEAWRDEAALALRGPLPGDVLVDQETGSVFFVKRTQSSSGVVTAQMQNNYFTTNRGWSYRQRAEVSPTSGCLVVVNSRIYSAPAAMYGRTQAGSDAVMLRPRGESGAVGTSGVVAGDYLAGYNEADSVFAPHDARVRAVSADRVQMSGPSAGSEMRQLSVFIRTAAD